MVLLFAVVGNVHVVGDVFPLSLRGQVVCAEQPEGQARQPQRQLGNHVGVDRVVDWVVELIWGHHIWNSQGFGPTVEWLIFSI